MADFMYKTNTIHGYYDDIEEQQAQHSKTNSGYSDSIYNSRHQKKVQPTSSRSGENSHAYHHQQNHHQYAPSTSSSYYSSTNNYYPRHSSDSRSSNIEYGNDGNMNMNSWRLENYGYRGQANGGGVGNDIYPLSWGLCVALLVILFFHYRDYSKKIQQEYVTLDDEPLTWQDKILDYTEYLGICITSFFQTLSPFNLNHNAIPDNDTDHNDSGNGGGINNTCNMSKRESGFSNLSSCTVSSKMPALIPIVSSENQQQQSASRSNEVSEEEENNEDEYELPPAFLNAEEYPDGWHVFDIKLGKSVPFQKPKIEVEKNTVENQLNMDKAVDGPMIDSNDSKDLLKKEQ